MTAKKPRENKREFLTLFKAVSDPTYLKQGGADPQPLPLSKKIPDFETPEFSASPTLRASGPVPQFFCRHTDLNMNL